MPFGGSTPTRKRAGQRSILVTLWSAGTTKDAILGQTPGAFVQFGTDDAAIDEVPFIVNATEHGVLYKVTLLYRADIVTEFETLKKRVRVIGGGKTLALLEIENPQRRNIQMVLHCAVA